MDFDFPDNETNLTYKLVKKDNLIQSDSTKVEAESVVVDVPIVKNIIPFQKKNDDLSAMISDLQEQLSLLNKKLDGNDATPEFKALMEGYIKKANESEEVKARLQSINDSYDLLKSDLVQLRELNRNLTQELNESREKMRDLEYQINSLETGSLQLENNQKEKYREAQKKIQTFEEKMFDLEKEKNTLKNQYEKRIMELIKSQESLKQELSDMDFDFRQRERELIAEIDDLNTRTKDYENILKEQEEKLSFKTKEAEYKASLLDQMAKQASDTQYKSKFLNNMVSGAKRPRPKMWPLS